MQKMAHCILIVKLLAPPLIGAGNVLTRVCLFVCLFVSRIDQSYYGLIFVKFEE